MTEKMYYYRLNADSELGARLRQLLSEIQRAQRAQITFLKNVGAEGYNDDESLMAGGVLCVSFPADKKVNERIWRKSHKDADGVQMYVPNVERRTGYIILPRKGFKPSDTWCRVYDKRVYSWPQAVSQYTMKQWAEMAGVRLTGDKGKDAECVNEALQFAQFAHYQEFYIKEWDPEVLEVHVKLPWWVREAVRLEVQRVKLPVVTVNIFYRLMQAGSPLPEGQTFGRINERLPNFFEIGGKFYVSCSRELMAEGLEAITAQKYNSKAAIVQDAERMSRQGGIGS